MDQNPLNPPKPPADRPVGPPANLPRPPVPAPVQPQPSTSSQPPSGPVRVRIPEPPGAAQQIQPPVQAPQAPAQPKPVAQPPQTVPRPVPEVPAPVPAPRLTPQPAPEPPKPVGVPTPPTEYRTSIRSMGDDISKIKVGQQPTGTEVQKTITPVQPNPAAPVPGPRLAPSAPSFQASLGGSERTKPLPVQPLPPSPVSGGSPGGQSRSWLYLLIITLVILGAVIYLISSQDTEVAEETSTPLPTQTATPTPTPSISLQFAGQQESIIVSEIDPAIDLQNKINAFSLNAGELKKVIISSQTKGSGDLSITDLMDYFVLPYPQNIKTALGEDYVTLVYGQKEAYTAKGQLQLDAPLQKRLIFLTEVREPTAISQMLSTWEVSMPNSLGPILNFDKAKASGTGFLDNAYNGHNVRFRNFPYPDHAIDYTIVRASNGRSYLVIAGSREAAFAIIDRLR